jgi:hypothetical protein
MDERFRNNGTQIGVKRIAGYKSKEEWQKIGINIINYKENGDLRKYESEVQLNFDY